MRLTLSSFIAACALAGGASVARSALRAGEGEAAGTFALGKVVGSSSHIRRTTERGQQLALQASSAEDTAATAARRGVSVLRLPLRAAASACLRAPARTAWVALVRAPPFPSQLNSTRSKHARMTPLIFSRANRARICTGCAVTRRAHKTPATFAALRVIISATAPGASSGMRSRHHRHRHPHRRRRFIATESSAFRQTPRGCSAASALAVAAPAVPRLHRSYAAEAMSRPRAIPPARTPNASIAAASGSPRVPMLGRCASMSARRAPMRTTALIVFVSRTAGAPAA